MPCLQMIGSPGNMKRCPKPTASALSGTGVGEGLCTEHWQALRNDIATNWPTLGAGFVDDYAKIEALFMDHAQCLRYLEALNGEMDRRVAQIKSELSWKKRISAAFYRKLRDDKPYIRLSLVLEHFESLCWFPTVHVLPLGILSEQDFYFYIARGLVLKDYGAGVKHGEFTHRLQWHIVSRCVTNDFTTPLRTGWNYSAFELYTELGVPSTRGGKQGGAAGTSVWGRLFDRAGLGNGYFEPDTFHRDVIQHTGFPRLHHSLSRRLRKRREELLAAEQAVVPGILEDLNDSEAVGGPFFWQRDLSKDPFERVPKGNGMLGMRDADLNQNLASLPVSFKTDPKYKDDYDGTTGPKLVEKRAQEEQVRSYVERKSAQGKWLPPNKVPLTERYPGGAWKIGDEQVPDAVGVQKLRAISHAALQVL